MKTLLTVILSGKSVGSDSTTLYDGVEIIYQNTDEEEKQFLARAIKSAKGKYIIIPDGKFLFADVQQLLNIIDKNTSDLVCFDEGIAVKTAIYKGIKDFTDAFSCRFFAVTGCKTILKTSYTPFKFVKESVTFTDDNIAGLLTSAVMFGKVKAKLSKEIYTYAFNILGERLVVFYIYAMLAIKDGTMKSERLVEFDNKLKAEIFLYLNLEKRFSDSKIYKLQKLRDNGFKLSWLNAKKFRKILG